MIFWHNEIDMAQSKITGDPPDPTIFQIMAKFFKSFKSDEFILPAVLIAYLILAGITIYAIGILLYTAILAVLYIAIVIAKAIASSDI